MRGGLPPNDTHRIGHKRSVFKDASHPPAWLSYGQILAAVHQQEVGAREALGPAPALRPPTPAVGGRVEGGAGAEGLAQPGDARQQVPHRRLGAAKALAQEGAGLSGCRGRRGHRARGSWAWRAPGSAGTLPELLQHVQLGVRGLAQQHGLRELPKHLLHLLVVQISHGLPHMLLLVEVIEAFLQRHGAIDTTRAFQLAQSAPWALASGSPCGAGVKTQRAQRSPFHNSL